MGGTQDSQTTAAKRGRQVSVRSETLGEVVDWLGDEADREWERAKDGLSDGYGGFDAYTRAIQHCQDLIVEEKASSGKHTEIALLKHLADTFGERLRKAEQAKDGGADYTYHDGQSDAFGWAAAYCRLMLEASLNGKESD